MTSSRTSKVQPCVFASILPSCTAAGTTIFDEEIDRVSLHVRHAPGQLFRSRHGKQRAARQRGAHHIAIAPAQNRFVPNCRQAIDLQVGIGRQQGVARSTPLRTHRPRVAAGQARQIRDQVQRAVGQLIRHVDVAQELEIGVVQSRCKQLSQRRFIRACMNQLDQQPLVLHLTHGQTAKTQQLADQ